MAKVQPIPQHKKLIEATRRATKDFTADLKSTLRKSGGKPTRGKVGGKSGKPNPWRKCQTCFHRVPELCGYCFQGRAGVTPKHEHACCPGPCVRCGRCRLECPGPCSECSKCQDRCSGHEKEAA